MMFGRSTIRHSSTAARVASAAASAAAAVPSSQQVPPALLSSLIAPYLNLTHPVIVKKAKQAQQRLASAKAAAHAAPTSAEPVTPKASAIELGDFSATPKEQRSRKSKALELKYQDFTHVKVAIIGRPNVGKSTLFNRFLGKKLAMANATPGLTRDRLESVGSIYDMKFTVIDSPGIEGILVDAGDLTQEKRQLTKDMMLQTSFAIQSADVILFMIDGAEGVTVFDDNVAHFIKKHIKRDKTLKKRIVLVANKCDPGRRDVVLTAGHEDLDQWAEVYSLGLGEPVCISAEHKNGFHNLYTVLIDKFKRLPVPSEGGVTRDPTKSTSETLHFAVVGRPNTGKSTLINKIVDESRLLTGPTPGVTRDPVAVDFKFGPKEIPVKIIDTAGIAPGSSLKSLRRSEEIDEIAMARSMRAIGFANVVGLTLDSTFCFNIEDNKQVFTKIPRREKSIAKLVLKEGRALMFLLTKFDTIQLLLTSSSVQRKSRSRLSTRQELRQVLR
eukprot:TRINITY_DN19585_c0_g1_i1.p1 TRINITY_DN19585_c0_g1~~TRINITY_DN19585_c0_g1_i1.p1  ORF type:complete len:499 (-),score=154.30 TRINITY_DN19585_c0_g1_i1:882-2378(-)